MTVRHLGAVGARSGGGVFHVPRVQRLCESPWTKTTTRIDATRLLAAPADPPIPSTQPLALALNVHCESLPPQLSSRPDAPSVRCGRRTCGRSERLILPNPAPPPRIVGLARPLAGARGPSFSSLATANHNERGGRARSGRVQAQDRGDGGGRARRIQHRRGRRRRVMKGGGRGRERGGTRTPAVVRVRNDGRDRGPWPAAHPDDWEKCGGASPLGLETTEDGAGTNAAMRWRRRRREEEKKSAFWCAMMGCRREERAREAWFESKHSHPGPFARA